MFKINEFGQRKQTQIDAHATQTYDEQDPTLHASIVRQVELNSQSICAWEMKGRIRAGRQ